MERATIYDYRFPNLKVFTLDEELPEIPLEISIRDKIGEIISLSDMEVLPEKIQNLCQNPNIIKDKIKRIREELIANLGNSSKLEVEYILKLKNQLKK